MAAYDPVCGINLAEVKPVVFAHDGQQISVCSNDCRDEFKRHPDRYLHDRPVIELIDVKRSYHMGDVDVEVLRGLSLRIFKGTFNALIGASGSGKSTSMYLIGSLDRPTSGTVRIDGTDTSTLTDAQLAVLRGKKIGFVFQQFHLLPSLTAIENVSLPAIFQRVPREQARAKAKQLLEEVGLGHRINHRPTEMSGGEQQRVAVARALINDPELLLADEPTGNLDSKTSDKIIEFFVDLWKRRHITILIVTHDPHVASHAERVLTMKDGRLIPDHGTAETLVWKGETV